MTIYSAPNLKSFSNHLICLDSQQRFNGLNSLKNILKMSINLLSGHKIIENSFKDIPLMKYQIKLFVSNRLKNKFLKHHTIFLFSEERKGITFCGKRGGPSYKILYRMDGSAYFLNRLNKKPLLWSHIAFT